MPQKNNKLLILLIAGAALVTLLVLGGAGTAYYFINKDYTDQLDVQKKTIETLSTQFEQGKGKDASILDEYAFYTTDLETDISGLSGTLEALNKKYPLLFSHGSDETLGIKDLTARMEAILPKLETIKQAVEEDTSMAKKLKDVLEDTTGAGHTEDLTGLIARNDALDKSLAGLAFTGALEEKRTAFAAAVKQRGAALNYFLDESAVSSELAALLADAQSKPEDLAAKFTDLGAKNDALNDRAAGIEFAAIVPEGMDVPGAIGRRHDQIAACIGYLGEVAGMQKGVADFSTQFEKSAAQGGKFAQKIAAYMTWVNKLKTLKSQLQAINDKKEYALVTSKRTIDSLGLSEKGKSLLSYEGALTAVNGALTKSTKLEKDLTSIVGNSKTKAADKKKALQGLVTKNQEIITALSAVLPNDLTAGLAKFSSGCTERATALKEYIAYLDDKSAADGYNSKYKSYSSKADDYLSEAAYYYYVADGYWSSNVEYYYGLYEEQNKLANAEKTKYNNSNKSANTHKSAYDASRKKYQPLLTA